MFSLCGGKKTQTKPMSNHLVRFSLVKFIYPSRYMISSLPAPLLHPLWSNLTFLVARVYLAVSALLPILMSVTCVSLSSLLWQLACCKTRDWWKERLKCCSLSMAIGTRCLWFMHLLSLEERGNTFWKGEAQSGQTWIPVSACRVFVTWE